MTEEINFIFDLIKEKMTSSISHLELELLKILGYDLEFNNIVDKETVDDKSRYISKSIKDKRIVPNFLIEKNQNSEDIKTLLSGLKLVGDYLDKTILKPNNLTQPLSRSQFINSLK